MVYCQLVLQLHVTCKLEHLKRLVQKQVASDKRSQKILHKFQMVNWPYRFMSLGEKAEDLTLCGPCFVFVVLLEFCPVQIQSCIQQAVLSFALA